MPWCPGLAFTATPQASGDCLRLLLRHRFLASGQGRDAVRGFFHTRRDFLDLGAHNRFLRRSGDETHDRHLFVGENRHRNGTDVIACLGVDPVQVKVLIAEVMLVPGCGIFQVSQTPGIVDLLQLRAKLCLCLGLQSYLVAACTNGDQGNAQLLIECERTSGWPWRG